MNLQDIAELLVASWVLGGSKADPKADPEPLPTSHGILDRALDSALKEGAFPQWQDRLHFVDSRIGFQCVELSSVIGVAQRAEFTEEPNPSYKTTRIKISASAARQLLRRRRLSEEEAARWGSMLHKSVETAKLALSAFPGGEA